MKFSFNNDFNNLNNLEDCEYFCNDLEDNHEPFILHHGGETEEIVVNNGIVYKKLYKKRINLEYIYFLLSLYPSSCIFFYPSCFF